MRWKADMTTTMFYLARAEMQHRQLLEEPLNGETFSQPSNKIQKGTNEHKSKSSLYVLFSHSGVAKHPAFLSCFTKNLQE